jgi:hypothetical protein
VWCAQHAPTAAAGTAVQLPSQAAIEAQDVHVAFGNKKVQVEQGSCCQAPHLAHKHTFTLFCTLCLLPLLQLRCT